MDTEKLPLREAFFGLIFAAIFLVAGAIAVSASYGNTGGGSHDTEQPEEGEHSEDPDPGDEKVVSEEDGDHSDG